MCTLIANGDKCSEEHKTKVRVETALALCCWGGRKAPLENVIGAHLSEEVKGLAGPCEYLVEECFGQS